MHYLTTAEVAERYRTAESTVRYWRQVGKGPRGIKIGKRVLYSEAELLYSEAELLRYEAELLRYELALAEGQADWDLAT
ncbi:helix-turn-helix transcriptional regulator [Streptomyces radiopugnans]|uniref:helix-turn-helix transcriptional regulator n=1 Tax=Streptomyces radiopugnans TaxID=403935 RepID=UPI003F1E1FAB